MTEIQMKLAYLAFKEALAIQKPSNNQDVCLLLAEIIKTVKQECKK